MIANPVEMEHIHGAGVQLNRISKIVGDSLRFKMVAVAIWKVGKHTAAIRRLPPEEFQRKLVCFIPVHLVCNEVVDSSFLIDLRQLPVKPK